MEADEFRVTYWPEGSPGSLKEINDIITYHTDNNTFTIPWKVPDELGPTRIAVKNELRPELADTTEVFHVSGRLRVSKPNGDAGEPDFHSLEPILVEWSTIGSVTNVNLFYKYGGGAWQQVNATPIANNGEGETELYTTTEWIAPDIITDSMLFRVQDADYSQVFDGTEPGPYDDSDNVFALSYYEIQWDIGYIATNLGVEEREPLDNLTVADTFLGTKSSLSCVGPNDTQTNIIFNYPYGVFDTIWYRPLFRDEVDFHWSCSNDHVRIITMEQTDLENPNVLANLSYQPYSTNSEDKIVAYTWLERSGHVVLDPQESTVTFYNEVGSNVMELVDNTPGPSGVFRMEWLDPTPVPLTAGETYPAYIEILHNGVTYDADIIYTIRLAGDAELDPIMDGIGKLEGDIDALRSDATNRLQEIADDTAEIRTGVGTLIDASERIEGAVTGLVETIGTGGGTNTMMDMLGALSNNVADIYGPITNIASGVSNINESTTTDDARILNRPTTVLLGSTNTILYKTARDFDDGTVKISVEGTSVNATMNEVTDGMGIYEYDLVADWGIGSYVVTCTDPRSTDSIVIDVVVSTGVGGLEQTVSDLESQVTNVTSIVQSLGADIPNLIGDISTQLAQLEAAVAAGGDTSTIDAVLQQTTTLEKTLADLISQSASSADQAAKSAQSAKTAASDAVAALQGMKDDMATGDMDGVQGRLDEIEVAIDQVEKRLDEMPKTLGVPQLQASMQEVAEQITELAAREGYEYGVDIEGAGGIGGEGADEDMIDILNRNMGEVKGSLDFLGKMLDAEQNAPSVYVDWIGVE